MGLKDIFKDNNDINEKSVAGFAALAMMILFGIVDILTGITGKELHVQEYIYNSFLFVVLGSFGISEAGKIFKKKDESK